MMKQWIKYVVSMLVCLGIALAIFCGIIIYQMHTPIVMQQSTIEIPKGTSLGNINVVLSAQQVITHPAVLWKIYACVTRQSTLSIRAGEYLIPKGSTAADMLKIFTSGKVFQHKVVLPPGITVNKALSILAYSPKLKNDLKGVSVATLAKHLGIKHVWSEGLFYADTYFYTAHSNASTIMLRAYQRLKRKLNHLWQNKAEHLPYKTPYEALIVASLIAKETGIAEERRKISGIFVRRLQQGMRLQSDPTVIYGAGCHFKGKLTYHDLRRKTVYNTYLINGLPPTPIALVTEADIDAALHPLEGKALYFVAKGDGTHVFSETLQDQQQAINKYKKQRRVDYHSTPLNNNNYHAGEKEVSNAK